MTSQLNVDTIVDKAGSGGTNVKVANTSTYVSDGGNVTQNTVQGIAKAWGNYDGSGTTLEDSFNYSSATDVNTGDYDMNFTNNMANANYSPTSTICAGGDRNAGGGGIGLETDEFRIIVYNTTSANEDSTDVVSTVHGDLA